MAELLQLRKLPLLDDVQDESADDVRVVLTPKSRNVDPAVLMESLFRQCDLETRIPLNMNILDRDSVPRVMDLRDVLRAYLDHRQSKQHGPPGTILTVKVKAPEDGARP